MAEVGEGSRVLLGDAEERLVAHDSERGDAQVVSLFFAPAPECVGTDARLRGQVAAELVVETWSGRSARIASWTRLDGLRRPADREVWFLASCDAKSLGRERHAVVTVGDRTDAA